jgi:hypothetical protein
VQTNISTANLAAKIWSLKKTNAGLLTDQPTIETDQAEYGKGHEYATATFLAQFTQGLSIERYLSSEFAAWLFAFGLGKVTVTGTGPYVYTCTPLNPANGDAAEPPYFTWVEQGRPGTNVVLDRAIPGMALEEFSISLEAGPDRSASKCSGSFMGSGRMIEPSTVTLPAMLAEHLLPANTLAFTVNGEDYIASKKWRSLSFGFKNNLTPQYDAGSGFRTTGVATSGVLASRLLSGDGMPTLSFVALYQNGSAEYAAIRNQTTNTCTISLTRDASNSLVITFAQVAFKTVVLSTSGQWLTVQVELQPMYNAGIVSAVVTTPATGICQ